MKDMISEKVGLEVNLGKLDSTRPDLTWDDNMQHIRIIGCDDMRQCEVKYEFGTLYFQEKGVKNGYFATVDMDRMFRRIFVALIKANDGMEPSEAIINGLRALPGFRYLDVAEEVVK